MSSPDSKLEASRGAAIAALAALREAAARDAADPALYTEAAVKLFDPLDVSALAVAGTPRHFYGSALARLRKAAPYLDALTPLLGIGRLWVAGGSIARAGYQHGCRLNPAAFDVDLFGAADETAAIDVAINSACKGGGVRVLRYCSEYAMTWVFETAEGKTLWPNLQYIRAPYADLRTCLGTFDIAQAQVAYDGTRLLFTAAAARAARLGVSLADAARVSPTWGHRVAKYSRFCAIAFPLPAGATRDFAIGASTFRLAGGRFARVAPSGEAAGAAAGADGAAAGADSAAAGAAAGTAASEAAGDADEPRSSYEPSSLQYGSRAAVATDLFNVARLVAGRPARAFLFWTRFDALLAEVAKPDGSGRWAARSALRHLLPRPDGTTALADAVAETAITPGALRANLERELRCAFSRARNLGHDLATDGIHAFAAAPVDHYTPADPAAFFGPELL